MPVSDGILLYYGKLFNDEIAKQLKISGSIASGKIGELAVPTIIRFGTEYGMALGYDKDNPAAIYYDFVNKGVRGFGGKKAPGPAGRIPARGAHLPRLRQPRGAAPRPAAGCGGAALPVDRRSCRPTYGFK